MENKKRLKEIKAKIKKIVDINKILIFGIIVLGGTAHVVESAIKNLTTPSFELATGIVLLALVIILIIFNYKIETRYLMEAAILQDKIFGKVSNEHKEQASKLLLDWKENYTFSTTFFRDINILKSFAIILLSRQTSQVLRALGKGFRLDTAECQEFYQANQKKLEYILKSKKDNKELQDLHQASYSLLKETSFSLE